jgi:hypothetical protein
VHGGILHRAQPTDISELCADAGEFQYTRRGADRWHAAPSDLLVLAYQRWAAKIWLVGRDRDMYWLNALSARVRVVVVVVIVLVPPFATIVWTDQPSTLLKAVFAAMLFLAMVAVVLLARAVRVATAASARNEVIGRSGALTHFSGLLDKESFAKVKPLVLIPGIGLQLSSTVVVTAAPEALELWTVRPAFAVLRIPLEQVTDVAVATHRWGRVNVRIEGASPLPISFRLQSEWYLPRRAADSEGVRTLQRQVSSGAG